MAAALGWSASETKKIKDAGFYHDIGKVVLKDELLDPSRIVTALDRAVNSSMPLPDIE
jgi:HD-GYP domain-containing protein (c-di-GMP phosphodiesterase class II)